MKRKIPTVVRPELEDPVALEFWNYCHENHLVVRSAATEAIREWLQRQRESQPIAS